MSRSIRFRLTRGALCAAVLALTACGNDTSVTTGTTGSSSTTPAALTASAGTGQTVTAGAAAATPFTVKVVNASGTPLAGVAVAWAITAGGGSLGATASTTDANGLASATYAAGTATVTATVGSLAPVTFTAAVTAAAVTNTLAIVSGNAQTVTASRAASSPFTVRVTNASGAAVSGATVTFAIASGGGSLSATTATTDASGNASVTYTAGATAGAATVTASIAGGTPVTFTTTITAGTTESVTDSTQVKVTAAIDAFKATLSATQLTTFQIAFTQANAAKWSNFPTTFAPRNGLRLADLTAAQQTLALAMVQAAMSDSGYLNRFNGVRQADNFLATIEPGTFGSGLYYVAVLGTPSTSSRWMFQFGGHHFAYNLSFNSVASTTTPTTITPYHTGSEPQAFTLSGAAYAPLIARKTAFYAMINSLDATQKAAAQLSQTFDDMLLGPGKDWQFPAQQGIVGSSLTAAQLARVKAAMEQWLQDVPAPIAAQLRADYEADSSLAKTYIAWSKTTDSTVAGSYIRIDGPRVWMEHNIQAGTTIKTQVHIHAIWRDKVRDYGGTISTASVEAAQFARQVAEARYRFTPTYAAEEGLTPR